MSSALLATALPRTCRAAAGRPGVRSARASPGRAWCAGQNQCPSLRVQCARRWPSLAGSPCPLCPGPRPPAHDEVCLRVANLSLPFAHKGAHAHAACSRTVDRWRWADASPFRHSYEQRAGRCCSPGACRQLPNPQHRRYRSACRGSLEDRRRSAAGPALTQPPCSRPCCMQPLPTACLLPCCMQPPVTRLSFARSAL